MDPLTPTSIPDDTYDVLLCCAGFFQGLISPEAFPEFIRITKKGGLIIWNICQGYEEIGGPFLKYDQIIDGLISRSLWKHFRKPEFFDKVVFTDCGAAYLSGYESCGVTTKGIIYNMQKI